MPRLDNSDDDDVVFLEEQKIDKFICSNQQNLSESTNEITRYTQEPVYNINDDDFTANLPAKTSLIDNSSIDCVVINDDYDDDIQYMNIIYEDRELLAKIDGKANDYEDEDDDLLIIQACKTVETERSCLSIASSNTYCKTNIKKPDKNEVLFDKLINPKDKNCDSLFSDHEDIPTADTAKKRRLSETFVDNVNNLSVLEIDYSPNQKKAKQEKESNEKEALDLNKVKKQLIEKTNQQSLKLAKYRKPTSSVPPLRRSKINDIIKSVHKHQSNKERIKTNQSGYQTTLGSDGQVVCTTTLTQGIRMAKQELSARLATSNKVNDLQRAHLNEKKSTVDEMSVVINKPPRPTTTSKASINKACKTEGFTRPNIEKKQTLKKINKDEDIVTRILKKNEEAREINTKLDQNETKKYFYEEFLFRLLRCTYDWLAEQENRKHPPPVIQSDELSLVLDIYDSYDDYYRTHFPLLILETWEEISYAWKENRSKIPNKPFKCWLISIEKNSISQELHELQCQIIINRENKSCGFLYEDDLVYLSLIVRKSSSDPHGLPMNIFGLIKKFTKLNINQSSKISDGLNKELQQLSNSDGSKKGITVYECVLLVRARHYSIQPGSQIEFYQMTNLSSTLRRVKALIAFKSQPYHTKILKPVITDPIWWPCKRSAQIDLRGYNEAQKIVISEASSLVLTPKNEPKFYFVQGPPGTGKSHTIIGLINTFFKLSKDSKVLKVLVCSPSNGGCDELLRRIKNALPFDKCNLVRAGRSESIHRDCENYLLDNLAKKRAAELAIEDNMKKNKSTQIHYDRFKQTEKNLLEKIAILKSNGRDKSRVKEEQEKLDEVQKRRERFEKLLKQNSNNNSTNRQNNFDKQAKELIIKEANIIVATLNYTGNSLFDCLTNQIGIVVIDEAAQCIEVDSLIPLRFGCNKIVLVGDPEQLPATVKNQRAQENGLGQSLFERIYLHFKYDDNNPIRMLYVQYRMHKDICIFPSKRFYKGKLTTDDDVTKKRSTIPLKHFLFFNLKSGIEITDNDSNSWSNEIEAQFVAEMCKYLVKKNFKNIGVITPYQKQLKLIQSFLMKNDIAFIDVGTVDGFQGREKDIIVFSSVRASNKSKEDCEKSSGIGFVSHRQRLNVALTRAKYSMYIVGNIRALSSNQDWLECIHHSKENKCIIDIEHEKTNYDEFNSFLLKKSLK